jgi:hypothetical protein
MREGWCPCVTKRWRHVLAQGPADRGFAGIDVLAGKCRVAYEKICAAFIACECCDRNQARHCVVILLSQQEETMGQNNQTNERGDNQGQQGGQSGQQKQPEQQQQQKRDTTGQQDDKGQREDDRGAQGGSR